VTGLRRKVAPLLRPGRDAWNDALRRLRGGPPREPSRPLGVKPPSIHLPGVEADPDRAGVYWVDVHRMKTPWGFGFGPGGWHPYTVTLQAIKDGGAPQYEGSPLQGIHESWQPASLADVIFDVLPRPVSPLDTIRPWGTLTMRAWLFHPRRIASLMTKSAHSKVGKATGEQQYGPCSSERAQENLTRLLRVERSMAERGYRPFDFEDGLVKGAFLIRDGDYRFLIWNGQHRVPVLAHLGIRQVAVRLGTPDIPAVVRDTELARWRAYVAGVLPTSLITALFREQFTEAGQSKAERLGLV
jgi:hypothetical protein